jgi:hypothetical protein
MDNCRVYNRNKIDDDDDDDDDVLVLAQVEANVLEKHTEDQDRDQWWVLVNMVFVMGFANIMNQLKSQNMD